MLTFKEQIRLVKAILSNPRIIKVRPAVNWFPFQYFRKFKIINIDGNFILHSHLPPLNSRAYSRFIDEHLLSPVQGPSHAQIDLTNACPQNCRYCYNKDRTGKVMDTATIKNYTGSEKAGRLLAGIYRRGASLEQGHRGNY